MSMAKMVALTLLALGTAPAAARGQDPVPLYPENYKVLVENDRVRVMDFMLRKGARESAHSHPAAVVYVLSPIKIRFPFPDGTTRLWEAKPGDVRYGEAVTHASENLGDTDAHGLLVELKGLAEQRASLGGSAADAAGLLTAVTLIRGLPGREDELKKELLALTAPTRAEAGAIAYDLYQSPVKPNEFMRFEVWRNEAALEAHKQTPHLRASFEKRKRQGWTTEITLWKRVGD